MSGDDQRSTMRELNRFLPCPCIKRISASPNESTRPFSSDGISEVSSKTVNVRLCAGGYSSKPFGVPFHAEPKPRLLSGLPPHVAPAMIQKPSSR
jgi:hypothetical protein